ncbi:spore maturation protein, partial [bacterium]|nr:spore maturation protein [bacterium]
LESLENTLSEILSTINVPADTIPIMIVRSLSGSAALGVFSDIANTLGPDDYATKLSAIMVGSSETTFYVLAVYFGAVGISKLRYALWVGLLADFIGIVAAIAVCNWMFL